MAEHGGIHAARALKDAGVSTIFALPGGHILPLFEGCRREGVRIIDTRHEAGATMAALGWALATGDLGVAAVTAGPGVANAFPGIAEAHAFGAPVALIAGKTGLRQQGRGAVQDLDQTTVMAPITKWRQTALKAERIPHVVAEALHRARSAPTGPTFVDVPQDLFMTDTELPETAAGFPAGEGREPTAADAAAQRAAGPAPQADAQRAAGPAPQADALAAALEILSGAERPVILAGGGAFWSGAGGALEALVEATGIPVTTTSSARGLVRDDHPLCLGSLIHGGIATASADVVLVLGSRFDANLSYGGHPLFRPDQRVIQVDVDAAAMGGNRRPDLAVVADVRAFCEALAGAWGDADGPGGGPPPEPSGGPPPQPGGTERLRAWAERCREAAATSRASWDAQTEHRSERINPGWLAREVATFARGLGTHTIVCDGGDSLVWGLAFARATGPGRHLFTGTKLGTLGVGMPFTLAAKAARPEEPTFLFTGDGAFGLSAMEFETAVRHRLPVVVVVVNNGGWGDVRHEQRAFYGEEADQGALLSDMRYDRMAEAMGGHGERVERPEDVGGALKRAADAGVPAIVDCLTDPDVESDLIRNLASLDVM